MLATLAVLAERPLRSDHAALVLGAAAAPRVDVDRLAVERVELRLVVERVDLARAAIHEQEDDGLRARREVRRLRRERALTAVAIDGAEEAVAREQVDEADRSEPRAGLPEELAACAPAERVEVLVHRRLVE